MSAIDSPWLPAQSRVVFGPLTLPSLSDLRAAFVELAAQGERTRAGYTLSPSARRWLFDPHRLAELAEQVVAERASSSTDDDEGYREMERLLETIEVDNDTAAHFTRAGDRLVFVQNHALGDVHLTVQLPSALVRLAQGLPLPAWVDAPLAQHPLWTAATHAAQPGRKPFTGLWRERNSGTRGGPGIARRTSVEWNPVPRTAFRCLSRGSWQEVKAWRKEHAPEASLASLHLVILRQALAAAGVAVTPETVVLYDCRRYLPGRAQVRGNFIVARSQRLGDDPHSVNAALAQTLDNAQPLATLVAATARNALRSPRTHPAPPAQIDPECLPAFVFPPRSGQVESMPWRRPDLRGMAVSSAPSRANAVTATMFLIGGRLSTSICYYPDVITDSSIHAAIALMEDHPSALLERSLMR